MNYRQIANLSISGVIQCIYLGVNMGKDPKSMLALYGPLIILVLVLVSLIYNIVFLMKELINTK